MNPSSQAEYPFPALASPTTDGDLSATAMDQDGAVQSPPGVPIAKPKERRASRPTRFTELERIESAPEGPHHDAPRMKPQDIASPLSHGQVVNMLPEAVAASEVEDGKKGKGKKLRKGGNKLVKKSRVASSSGGK